MIPIQRQPEPSDFDARVRRKGQRFLNRIPHPHNKQWDGQEHWRAALPEMRQAYDDICAYCGQWISHPTGSPTIDHFLPRALRPDLAYEWNNFRLTCLTLNSRKGTHTDVLDPFALAQDWFVLDFSSWLIRPNALLPDAAKTQVEATITRLKLNDDEAFVQSRAQWYHEYEQEHGSFSFLEKKAPFIAYEARRQGLAP